MVQRLNVYQMIYLQCKKRKYHNMVCRLSGGLVDYVAKKP